MSEIINLHKLFSWAYLTQTPSIQMRYSLIFTIILAIFLVFGGTLQIVNQRKIYPRFYKKFIKRIGDFFIYIPFILILLILARLGGVTVLSMRIYLVAILFIWLIWFFYLVYYRLVIIPAMWSKYKHRKREESYRKNGKAR
jgi:hypothetical protein